MNFILHVEGRVWRPDKPTAWRMWNLVVNALWYNANEMEHFWNGSVWEKWNYGIFYLWFYYLWIFIRCENFFNVFITRETPLDYYQEFLFFFVTSIHFFNTFRMSYLFEPNLRSLCIYFMYFVCVLEPFRFLSFWHLEWFRSLLVIFYFKIYYFQSIREPAESGCYMELKK